MTPNLALNSDCNEWQACRSHITNLSIHSFTCVSLPGYHAGSKSTQIYSEECCVYSVQYLAQIDEGLCFQERGVCRDNNMIWDLVRGIIQKSVIWLFVFYMHVLCFIMWSTIEWDVHTLGLTQCVFSSLLWLKPYCLICMIGYTERNWCHIVATTARKISAQYSES